MVITHVAHSRNMRRIDVCECRTQRFVDKLRVEEIPKPISREHHFLLIISRIFYELFKAILTVIHESQHTSICGAHDVGYL